MENIKQTYFNGILCTLRQLGYFDGHTLPYEKVAELHDMGFTSRSVALYAINNGYIKK